MVPGILFEEYFLMIFIVDWRLRKSSRYLYAPYVLFMWKEIIEYYHTRRMVQQCDLLIRYRQNVLDVNCMGDTPACRRSGVDIPKKELQLLNVNTCELLDRHWHGHSNCFRFYPE